MIDILTCTPIYSRIGEQSRQTYINLSCSSRFITKKLWIETLMNTVFSRLNAPGVHLKLGLRDPAFI